MWQGDGSDAAVEDGTISGRAGHASLPEHYILGLTTTITPKAFQWKTIRVPFTVVESGPAKIVNAPGSTTRFRFAS